MRRPSSTYRLQLSPAFGFAATRERVDYLHRLGIGDAYLSPILAARPGSTHGYDCADPTRLNPELGAREELDALADALHRRGMGILLDIVPNHMAAHTCNPWWADVLRNGPGSRWAGHFDIRRDDDGRMLLPVLGAPLEQVLQKGELVVEPSPGGGELIYFEHHFPLNDAGVELMRGGAGAAEVHAAQHYRLAHWRRAAEEVGYRRFFDVSELVGMRVEDPAVFDDTHMCIRELVEQGIVDGLRVDHVDGLLEPGAYLVRLQERLYGERGGHGYVVVEKILEDGEELPGDWPVDGTTGYDFLNAVNGLFVATGGIPFLTRAYARFAGADQPFEDVVFRRKLQVQDELFGGELRALAHSIATLGAAVDVPTADEADVARALAAVTAALPRYRTYFARDRIREQDRSLVREAVADARRRVPEPGDAAYDVVEHVLSLRGHSPPDVPAAELDAVARWQQYSGPVMAKGHEDTALYVYVRLVSANAVGGNPADPASLIEDFHAFCRRRARSPGTMNATSTHDSKRSEDVRARIDVLSEMPERWEHELTAWREANAPLRRDLDDGRTVPDANTEMLAYQTLVGAWPLEPDRLDDLRGRFRDYLIKAAREAKSHTSWIEQDRAYEDALTSWAEAVLRHAPFLERARAFTRITAAYGALTSLAQVLVKTAAPGVPDFYQGTELWDLSLVDPDNRRPVDWSLRERLLDRIEPLVREPEGMAARELWDNWRDGRVKLYTTTVALRDRRDNADLYRAGEYLPLRVRGPLERHVLAFARRTGESWRIIAVPMRLASVQQDRSAEPAPGWPIGAEIWEGTSIELPPGAPREWLDAYTGTQLTAVTAGTAVAAGAAVAALPAEQVFASFPVSLLRPSP